jgi:LmbE family N-acetylglucosaminyl deacetylase
MSRNRSSWLLVRVACVGGIAFSVFLTPFLAPADMAPRLYAQGEATPNQELMKTDLLVVTAHPDDESMMGATMARYADAGKIVALVACTHGEGGGNGTGTESGAALGVVREAELRQCLVPLGVRHLYFLNQPDWAYTESVQATLQKWGHDESLRRLVRLVRILRPEVICTMDPAPVGGQHGHHQAAGRLATEVFEAAADPDAYPELRQVEGLAPWRVRKLYWTSFRGGTLQIATDGVAAGMLAGSSPGQRYADIARKAARKHRSQGFDKFLANLAGATSPTPARPNGFLLVKSRVLVNPRSEKDLFDGIGSSDLKGTGTLHDLLAPQLSPKPSSAAVVAQLRPRDNVLNYRSWLKANGISRLLTRLPAQVTVVRGRPDQLLEIEVSNQTAQTQQGTVYLDLPHDWPPVAGGRPFIVPAGGAAIVHFHATVPQSAEAKSYDLTARCNGVPETAKADVVPALDIAPLAAPLPVDADPAKWQAAGIIPVAIAPPSGQSPRECSGRFYVGHDSSGFQVLVDVTDDCVARNIAPDDIRGHWRSTSVEICIDPSPRSENTFSTFKLGIIPHDTSGKVRAARDADAFPGELGFIHSRIQLASRLTLQGYIVEARIPWSELGRAIRAGDALGFNVILYHAGKRAARVGEDIGKSRLAWSFWPGVQGRPEVWGLAMVK